MVTQPLDELNEFPAEVAIVDEASADDTVVPDSYDIVSYGADYDVEGLVKRLQRGDIIIPEFQRSYVWSLPEASRFVESLLLGLPVPGIFLAREPGTNRLLVIDGQQRLKTLQYFYEGYFNPKDNSQNRRVFKLTKVQPQYEGASYNTLEDQARLRLNDSVIHATVIKQEAPPDDSTSIYHVFERLNNEGRKLTPQEMRTALYYGDMIALVKELNENTEWRRIFGPRHNRLKDQELVLRFFALYFEGDKYQRPMEEFLTRFARKHGRISPAFQEECRRIFPLTTAHIWRSLGQSAFRPEKTLNAAVTDSVLVGLARSLQSQPVLDSDKVRAAYEKLLQDRDYNDAVSQATSDEKNVSRRIAKATEYFARLA
jgi:hypothetical protein